MTDKLETRINAALNNGATSSATITELIKETETAIAAAEQIAEQEAARARDLTCTDPDEAYKQARAAVLRRDRLAPTLAKLRDKFSAAVIGERHARWFADYRRVEEEHDALGQEFADFYRGLSVQLADL